MKSMRQSHTFPRAAALVLAAAAPLGALVLIAFGAGAQPVAPALPTLKSVGLTCDDFATIGAGYWKATHPLDLAVGAAKQTISPVKPFGPSETFLGLPLAKMLTSECDK